MFYFNNELLVSWDFLVVQRVKNLRAMQETQVWFLGQEDALEREMATYSSILACKIPQMEELGGLQSIGLQRVGHDWATSFSLGKLFITCMRAKLLQPYPTLCDPMDHSPARLLLSMGFSRQKYWSGLPFPSPGDLPVPGIKPRYLTSPALAGGIFTTIATWDQTQRSRPWSHY